MITKQNGAVWTLPYTFYSANIIIWMNIIIMFIIIRIYSIITFRKIYIGPYTRTHIPRINELREKPQQHFILCVNKRPSKWMVDVLKSSYQQQNHTKSKAQCVCDCVVHVCMCVNTACNLCIADIYKCLPLLFKITHTHNWKSSPRKKTKKNGL